MTCRERTAEERYSLVARVLAGESQKSVAISAEIEIFMEKKKILYPSMNSRKQ